MMNEWVNLNASTAFISACSKLNNYWVNPRVFFCTEKNYALSKLQGDRSRLLQDNSVRLGPTGVTKPKYTISFQFQLCGLWQQCRATTTYAVTELIHSSRKVLFILIYHVIKYFFCLCVFFQITFTSDTEHPIISLVSQNHLWACSLNKLSTTKLTRREITFCSNKFINKIKYWMCSYTVIFDADVCTHVRPAEPHCHVGTNHILSADVEGGTVFFSFF